MSDSIELENLLGMLTIKLNDDNFIKWNFQFCSVLRGYDLFYHFIGESVCPPKFVLSPTLGVTTEVTTAYKTWVKADMALLSLLIATLSDDAMEYVVGCKTAHEAWTALQDRYIFVSSASVNHLKAELHTIQKGSDNVDKYLLRLKTIKDKLLATGEKVTDNDIVIAALTGLPADFDMIRTIILARDTPISLKEFRAQLLGVEKSLENRMQSLVQSMAAMYVNGSIPTSASANSNIHPASNASGISSGSSSLSQLPSNFGFGFLLLLIPLIRGLVPMVLSLFNHFHLIMQMVISLVIRGIGFLVTMAINLLVILMVIHLAIILVGIVTEAKAMGGYRPKFNGNRSGFWS